MSLRIVLVGTTHPGNIGAVARAMKNMGLSDLRLVRPKVFPHEDATARASGASDILERAVVCDTLAEALEGCVYVAGASARSRTINWPCMGPRDCAERMIQESAHGIAACVFGPEKTGLFTPCWRAVRPSTSQKRGTRSGYASRWAPVSAMPSRTSAGPIRYMWNRMLKPKR